MSKNTNQLNKAIVLYDLILDKLVTGNSQFILFDGRSISLTDYMSKEDILSFAEDIRDHIYHRNTFDVWLDQDGNPVSIAVTNSPPIRKIVLDQNKKEAKKVSATTVLPKYLVGKDDWIKRWTAWMNNKMLQEEMLKAKDRIKDNGFDYYNHAKLSQALF